MHDLAARGSRKRSQAKGEAMPIYRVTFLKDIMGVPFPVASIAVRHARSPDRAPSGRTTPDAAGRCRTGTSSPIHRTSNGRNRSAAPGPLGPQRRRTDDSAWPALDGSLPSRRRAVHPGDLDHRVASRIIAAVHKVVELTKPRIARVNEGRVGRRALQESRNSSAVGSPEATTVGACPFRRNAVGATNLFKFGYRS